MPSVAIKAPHARTVCMQINLFIYSYFKLKNRLNNIYKRRTTKVLLFPINFRFYDLYSLAQVTNVRKSERERERETHTAPKVTSSRS